MILPTLAAGLSWLAAAAVGQTLGEVYRVDVRPGWRVAGTEHIAGLEITLAPGWHTYWRQPGDVGIPPRFAWATGLDIADVAVDFPLPEVMHNYGMRSIGYYNHVVLPLRVTATHSGPLMLGGMVTIGVCEEICIPVEVSVTAELPAQGRPDPTIVAALEERPAAGRGAALCQVSPTEDALALEIILPHGAGERRAVVIEVGAENLWVSEPTVTQTATHLVATAEVIAPNGRPAMIDRSNIVTTILYDTYAVEYTGCLQGSIAEGTQAPDLIKQSK